MCRRADPGFPTAAWYPGILRLWSLGAVCCTALAVAGSLEVCGVRWGEGSVLRFRALWTYRCVSLPEERG